MGQEINTPIPAAQKKFNLAEFRLEGITDRDAKVLYGDRAQVEELLAMKIDLDGAKALEAPVPGDDLFTGPARKILESRFGCDLRVCFAVNSAMPFIRAEIDAANFEKKILVRINVSGQALPPEMMKDGIPRLVWIELQHQMLVTGLQSAYYAETSDGTNVATVEIKRDDLFVSNHTAECIQIWDKVRRGVGLDESEPTEKQLRSWGLDGLVEEAHQMARAKGWYEGGAPSALERHMLMVSEIAEATEEVRKGRPAFYQTQIVAQVRSIPGEPEIVLPTAEHWDESIKPEGEAVELADVVIRIADHFGAMGWSLDDVIAAKLKYNATRPHRHGGKRY